MSISSLFDWLVRRKQLDIIAANERMGHRPTVKLGTVQDVHPLLRYPPPTQEQLRAQAAVSLGKDRERDG